MMILNGFVIQTLVFFIVGVKSNADGKGRIQPWQRGLIPLHLFAEAVEIPDIRADGKMLIIKAPLPRFFSETLQSCGLKPRKYNNAKRMKHFTNR